MSGAIWPDFWFDPTPDDRNDNAPPSNKIDFIAAIMHEFTHALGFGGLYAYSPPPTGSAGLENEQSQISEFDRFIEWDNSQDSFLFTGTNATAAYHQLGFTGNLPLHSEGNNISDLHHYGNVDGNDDPLDLYLMDNDADFGNLSTISSLDTAILQDLGYLIG